LFRIITVSSAETPASRQLRQAFLLFSSKEICVMSKPQTALSAVISTPLGMMRPAAYHEITAYVREMEARAEWEDVRDFAYQLFGERAHQVQVVTGDEYDDEHYFTVVENVIVYDAEKNLLPYDLTLPYWNQVGPDQLATATSLLQDFENWLKEEEAERTESLSQEERERLLQEYADGYVRDNNLYANEFDLPREDRTFILDEPPPEIAAPPLYVCFEQEEKQQAAGKQAIEEREQRTCTLDFTIRGNISLRVHKTDQGTEDAKGILECLDSKDGQVIDLTIFDVEVY
jgi:hypothetical protein